MSQNTDQRPELKIEPDPWNLDLIYLLQDIGLASDAIYPILATAYLAWAWLKFKGCKYDKVLIMTLWLFEGMIITRFLQNIFNNVDFSRNSLWYRIVNAIVVPTIYALAMCAVYLFIFQLERVRLLLVLSNNRETVEFNNDQSRIKIL